MTFAHDMNIHDNVLNSISEIYYKIIANGDFNVSIDNQLNFA